MAIKSNSALWSSTALLVVYDEHGGIYDHVKPPACPVRDEFSASAADTGIGQPFDFDRFGVRVPAVLVSPWIPKNTVVDDGRLFEHASIPATVMDWLIPGFPANQRTAREAAAPTFLDLLSSPVARTDHSNF
jgi:phospholipase C